MRTVALSIPVAISIVIIGCLRPAPTIGPPTLGGPGLPANKQARLDAQASAQALAKAASGPKAASAGVVEQTDPPPDYSGSTPAGNGHLFVTTRHPMGEANEIVTTEWDEELVDSKLSVWAGSFSNDPMQGFVEFVRFNTQGGLVGRATIDLPVGSGPATIVGATQNVLHVTDAHGGTFSYAPLGQGLQQDR